MKFEDQKRGGVKRTFEVVEDFLELAILISSMIMFVLQIVVWRDVFWLCASGFLMSISILKGKK